MLKWLFRAIFLLALGITAHDFASIYGVHFPGYHAYYFAVPIMLICLFVLWVARGRK